MKAASRGDTKVVLSCLLADVECVNEQDAFGNTALMFAAGDGHLEAVQLLVSHGAQVNLSNRVGATALSRAVAKRHERVARLLRSCGAVDKNRHVNPQEEE